MELFHLSDLHIGKRVNGFSMIEDQRHIFAQVIQAVETHKPDAILIAGDLYDKAAPSAEAVSVLDDLLCDLAHTGCPVYATAGNHDSPDRVAYASRLLAREGIHLSPVYNGAAPEPITSYLLHDEYGPVRIWMLPFLRPAMVRPFFEDEPVETYTDALRLVISRCPIDTSIRNVMIAHQFVTSSGVQTIRCDSELSLGTLDDVDASVFDDFDYVALGHLHRPQRVGRDEMRYSGSPLKYSLSEVNDTKSMPIVTLREKGHVEIELLPLTPLHDMRTIKGPLCELISPEVVQAADPLDYIHAILTDEDAPYNAIAQLRAHYPHVMSLAFDNTRTRATGSMQLIDQYDDALSPLEHFQNFYLQQNGLTLSAAQTELVRRAFERTEA